MHVERQIDERKKKKWRRFGFSSVFIHEFTKSSPLIRARIQISDWVWVCNIPERPADIKPYDQSLAPFVLKAWTRTWYFVFLKSPLNKQFLPSECVVQLCQVLLSIATWARKLFIEPPPELKAGGSHETSKTPHCLISTSLSKGLKGTPWVTVEKDKIYQLD